MTTQHYLCGAAALVAFSLAPLRGQTSPESATGPTVQLNPFVVQESSDQSYASSQATSVGRVVQPLENIPQQVDVFTAAFIDAVQPTTFQDALRFDAAVSFNNTQFNGASAQVRGFDTVANGGILRNGEKVPTAGGLGSVLGLEAIDQVEVVKGAASILYGPSQPGGIINYVTKRPLFNQQEIADVTFFSEGGYSGTLDITGPIPLKSSDGRDILAYRIVGTHEDRGLYQINNQYLQRDMLYAALTFKPFKDLSIDANWEVDRQKTSFFNAQLVPQAEVTALGNFVTGALKPSQAPLPYNIYPQNWTDEDTNGYLQDHDKVAQFSATLSHDFNKLGRWTLRAFYTYSETSLFRVLDDVASGNNPQPVTAANIGDVVNFNQAVTAADVAAGRLWIPARYLRQIDGYPSATMATQWDLTGQFTTGPVKHTLLIGSDESLGVDNHSGMNGVVSIESDAMNTAGPNANAIWVDHPDLRSITNYNYNDTQTVILSGGVPTTVTVTNPAGTVTQIVGKTSPVVPQSNLHYVGIPWLTNPYTNGSLDKPVYAVDALSFWDDRVQLSVGARFDELSQNIGTVTNDIVQQNRWTYRYGGVFKLLPELHLFALHSESFNPNSTAAMQAFGYYIAPQAGKQNEAGVRLFLFQKRLDVEASVYRISVTNVVQTNPFGNVGVVPPIPANNYSFVPGETDNGVDVTAKLNISKHVQLLASYTHSHEETAAGPAQLALGISQYPVNNQPNDQVALFGRWSPEIKALTGFYFTAGYNYTGRRPAGAVGALPSIYLNSYSVTDIGAGYEHGRWSLSALVSNLFNVYAFRTAPAVNRLFPEEPRQATFEIKVKF